MRKYQLGEVNVHQAGRLVAFNVDLKVNRRPFTVRATGYGYLTPEEARRLGKALTEASRAAFRVGYERDHPEAAGVVEAQASRARGLASVIEVA